MIEQIVSQYHSLVLAPCLGPTRQQDHPLNHHRKHQQEVRQELYLPRARTEYHSIRRLASLCVRHILEEGRRGSTPSAPFHLNTPNQIRKSTLVRHRTHISARDPKSRASYPGTIYRSSLKRNTRTTTTMSSHCEDHRLQVMVPPTASNLRLGGRRAGTFCGRCHRGQRRQLEVELMSPYQRWRSGKDRNTHRLK